MVPEFDPVRPVHPTWPGRRTPEEGDERKRPRRGPVTGQEDEPGNEGTDDGESPERDDRRGGGSSEPGGTGRHVDDYA